MILDSRGCPVINATEWIQTLKRQGWTGLEKFKLASVEERALAKVQRIQK